jgi:hypothetical protein
MLKAIFLACVMLCTPSALGQPLPNAPEQKTTTTPRQTRDDNRGSDERPLTVKVFQPPKSEEETTADRQERAEKQEADRWLVRLTGILGFIGVLQLIAFIIQARRLGQTVDVMKATAERQLRAYVMVESIRIDAAPVEGTIIRIQIKNFGTTPAHEVVHVNNFAVDAFPTPISLPPSDAGRQPIVPRAVLPPSGTLVRLETRFLPAELSEAQKQKLKAGAAALYVFGRIDCVDAFGKPRWTEYRFFNYPAYTGPTDFAQTEEGNRTEDSP